MTTYVDDQLLEAAVRHGAHVVRGRWSHLLADSTAELHEFALRLGLKKTWLQKPGTPLEHYDITAGKRRLAIELGAVEISTVEGGHLARAKRAGVPFDLQLLRAAPEAFTASLALPSPAPSAPARVRLSRAAGATLPPNTVSVAAPTRWANPYRPARRTPQANQAAVEHFTAYLRRNPALVDQAKSELHGRNLACWCAPELPCHADVWLALVNPGEGPVDDGLRHG